MDFKTGVSELMVMLNQSNLGIFVHSYNFVSVKTIERYFIPLSQKACLVPRFNGSLSLMG